jgi:hypothetical protein
MAFRGNRCPIAKRAAPFPDFPDQRRSARVKIIGADHGCIDDRLRRVLDTVFRDELVRLRSDYGPRNSSMVQHTVRNPIRGAGGQQSLQVRSGIAAGNHDPLKGIITGTAN